jgi:hypothetical protein
MISALLFWIVLAVVALFCAIVAVLLARDLLAMYHDAEGPRTTVIRDRLRALPKAPKE